MPHFVDAHHFVTMLLLFYSDANVGVDAIGFERVYLKRGGWGGLGMIQSTLPCLGQDLFLVSSHVSGGWG